MQTINHEPNIDSTSLYSKDPFEAKYQLLVNKRESTSPKYLNDQEAFEYSNDINHTYKNIEEYSLNKIRKI